MRQADLSVLRFNEDRSRTFRAILIFSRNSIQLFFSLARLTGISSFSTKVYIDR